MSYVVYGSTYSYTAPPSAGQKGEVLSILALCGEVKSHWLESSHESQVTDSSRVQVESRVTDSSRVTSHKSLTRVKSRVTSHWLESSHESQVTDSSQVTSHKSLTRVESKSSQWLESSHESCRSRVHYRVQTSQNKLVRIILKLPVRPHLEPSHFESLKWLKVEDTRQSEADAVEPGPQVKSQGNLAWPEGGTARSIVSILLPIKQLTLRQTSCEFTCGHDVGDMVHLQASYVSLMYNVKLTG